MAYGRGHVRGTRKVSYTAQAWYQAEEARHIARIEAEWQCGPCAAIGDGEDAPPTPPLTDPDPSTRKVGPRWPL